MSAGDWIAFAAAVVAAVSCAVAVIAFRLQGRTQAASDEKRLSDLVEKMQKGLADLAKSSEDQTFQSFATRLVTLTSLRGQALEARKVIGRASIKPDWFQSMILAYSFSETWDLASSKEYWDGALTASKDGNGQLDHPAHISGLMARAHFYYSRGLGNDWDLARKDFNAAFDELKVDPDGQGPDLVNEQLSGMCMQQSSFELDAEGEAAAFPLIVEAFVKANSIAAGWRRRRALGSLGTLVAELQRRASDPDLLSKVKTELAKQGVHLDDLPPKTAAVLSMPRDGSLFAPQPADAGSAAS